MMRSRLPLVLALLLASSTSVAATINDDYRVSGDAQARPVQAFDDGRWLYVQLRDPMSPPAPIGPHGPMAYQIRGHYLVLPITPSVTLRYGPYTARVNAYGAGYQAPGVVSVTRPVEVDPVRSVVPISPPRPLGPAPVMASSPAPNEVSGEIVVAGSAGTKTVATGGGGADGSSLTYAQAAASSSYSQRKGQSLVLLADGTTAGARAALQARSACESAGATCVIEYEGASRGTIMVMEKNG